MAKFFLLHSAITASGAFLAAGSKSHSMLYSMPDPSAKTEGNGFIDEVTAYCYKVLWPGFSTHLDATYAKGVTAMTVDRPGTTHWCLGNMTTPPTCTGGLEPGDYARRACPKHENCVRGYDLMEWPAGAGCDTARILYIHGGSWYYDSPWNDDYSVHTSKIVEQSGAVVFSIDYPLVGGWKVNGSSAGEYTGSDYIGNAENVVQYALEAWRWLASNGPNKMSCASSKTPAMFVAGDSSGGGTAMQLLMDLLMKEKSGHLKDLPFPAGAFFESPWLNLRANSPTYYSNNFAAFPDYGTAHSNASEGGMFGDFAFSYFPGGDDASYWPEDLYEEFLGNQTVASPFIAVSESAKNAAQYCGCQDVEVGNYSVPLPSTCMGGTCGKSTSMEEQLKNPKYSPFWASREMLHGMPPIYFATSGTELLASDTSIFAQKLAELGGHVRAELFDGMWHTFPQWSEGCGGGHPLWQGEMALSHYGQFVQQVVEAWKTCPEKLRASPHSKVPPPQSRPGSVIHPITGGNEGDPWVVIPPLDLDICNSPPPALLGTGGRKPPRRLRAHRPREGAAAEDGASMLQLPPQEEDNLEWEQDEALEDAASEL